MLGLVIWILIQPVMAFVIPSEIGKMYRKDGEPRSAAGRAVALPGHNPHHSAIVWFVKGAGRSERLLGDRRRR